MGERVPQGAIADPWYAVFGPGSASYIPAVVGYASVLPGGVEQVDWIGVVVASGNGDLVRRVAWFPRLGPAYGASVV